MATYYVDSANAIVNVVSPSGANVPVSLNTGTLISVADVIAEGPDNQMWIFGTKTGTPTIMTLSPNGTQTGMTLTGAPIGIINSMVAGPDGNMWFSQTVPSAGVGKITPGGVVTMASPDLNGTPNAGLTVGSDGCIWGTEAIAGNPAIYEIFVSGTYVGEFTSGLSVGANPIGGIVQGGDGNLWFAEQGNNSVGRVTTSGAITEYFAGAGHVPDAMVLAPNGEMWFTEQTKNTLGWLTY